MEKSGGLATNIGIHFFDLVLWLFGKVEGSEVHLATPTRTAGYMELENARVKWFLSIEKKDLPEECKSKGRATFRSITIDGKDVEFSEGFTDLHTIVYRETLEGRGFGLEDARPSVVLAHDIRNAKIIGVSENSHPLVKSLL